MFLSRPPSRWLDSGEFDASLAGAFSKLDVAGLRALALPLPLPLPFDCFEGGIAPKYSMRWRDRFGITES